MPISTKERITFEAPDGSKWTIRPMTVYEQIAWSDKLINEDDRINTNKLPLDYCVIGWENLKDRNGDPVVYSPTEKPSEQLAYVYFGTINHVNNTIIATTVPSKEQLKNYSSAPSGTAEN